MKFNLNCIICFSCLADMFSCFVPQMITKNFEDYPEHRLKFFSLLRAIATHCFPALIRLSSQVCIKNIPCICLFKLFLNP